MAVDNERYTLEHLLSAAREQGFDPSKRLFKDWVTLGLLDQSTRRGRGRGKGVEATWSHEQKELFLLLLAKRAQVKRIATLCNIPVWIWLWYGEQFVSLRQARRALATWAGGDGRVPWRRARWTAEQLVSQFAHPDAKRPDRKKLIEAIARSAFGKPFSPEEILGLLERVFDPDGSGRAIGPPWMNVTPESFVLLTEARVRALRALREDQLDEQAFQWARGAYRESRSQYAKLAPSLAANAEAGELFLHRSAGGVVLPPTVEETVNQSCTDLLTLLGIHLDRLGSGAEPESSAARADRPDETVPAPTGGAEE